VVGVLRTPMEVEMDKRGWMVALAAVVVVAIVAVVAVEAAANGDASTGSGSPPPHSITVTSTASVQTAPDEAVVTFGVHAQAADASSALDANAASTNQVIAALQSAGLKKADLETTNVDLSGRTLNRGKPNETKVYVASSTIDATIHDLPSVGDVITAGVRGGANEVRGVRFQVSDQAAARERALTAAVNGAREKADAMAKAAGTQVDGVIDIQEQGAQTRPYFAPYAHEAGAAAPSVQVLPPRTLPTQVTVQVTWELAA
jgi:uncharacterized protein